MDFKMSTETIVDSIMASSQLVHSVDFNFDLYKRIFCYDFVLNRSDAQDYENQIKLCICCFFNLNFSELRSHETRFKKKCQCLSSILIFNLGFMAHRTGPNIVQLFGNLRNVFFFQF